MTIEGKIMSDTFFEFNFFSGSAELFIGYALLQLSLYALTMHYFSGKGRSAVTHTVLPNFSLVGFFVFFLSFFLLVNEDILQHNSNLTDFNLMLLNDHLSFLTKSVLCLTISCFFLTISFARAELSLNNSFEYFSFLATSSLGSLLLCSAGDFITAYLAIELQSIAFYLMACSKKTSSYSTESGLKYFIIGSFSSAFFLLGASFIYVCCGTLSLTELRTISSLFLNAQASGHTLELGLLYTGFALIGVSLLIKLAAAPFHLWSLDVYETAPTSTTKGHRAKN